MTISKDNLNKLISEDQAVHVPGLSEGATGGLIEVSDNQLVVYSEPVE